MSGLGGLNKSPNGVVIGVVQLKLPVVATRADLKAQCARVVEMVGKARRNMATMDLVVFPEYSLHGLSMDMNPEIMCSLDGPEVAGLAAFDSPPAGSLLLPVLAAGSGLDGVPVIF